MHRGSNQAGTFVVHHLPFSTAFFSFHGFQSMAFRPILLGVEHLVELKLMDELPQLCCFQTRRDLFLEDTEGEFIDQYRLSKEVTLDLLAKIEHLLPTSETNRGVLRYLLVLSAYTNLGKILHMNHKASPGNITCLHALRFSGLVPVPTSVATHESPHLHHLSAGTAPAEPGQGLLLHPPQHGDNQCMVLQTYTAAL
ncbi:uncharacterized protein LOC135095827 isoform X1 [Scylla paramamosain]|uniref:uncharacterized protein LOC135095827 isoform X1 n=1 Tax=Scylla paramamosain TaxID=85552 RepID=UPI003083D1CA